MQRKNGVMRERSLSLCKPGEASLHPWGRNATQHLSISSPQSRIQDFLGLIPETPLAEQDGAKLSAALFASCFTVFGCNSMPGTSRANSRTPLIKREREKKKKEKKGGSSQQPFEIQCNATKRVLTANAKKIERGPNPYLSTSQLPLLSFGKHIPPPGYLHLSSEFLSFF